MGTDEADDFSHNVVSDVALWSRSLEGDRSAFTALFDRHHDRVFRHARRLLEDRTTAEDVMGTVFFELWRRRRAVRVVHDSVLPWLLVTATNASRNAQRSTRRYRAVLDVLPRSALSPDAADVAFADNPLAHVDPSLSSALQQLPPKELRLLTLVALEGYSVSDAAAALGMSEPAAQSRLHRARTKVRAVIPHTIGQPMSFIDERNRA